MLKKKDLKFAQKELRPIIRKTINGKKFLIAINQTKNIALCLECPREYISRAKKKYD